MTYFEPGLRSVLKKAASSPATAAWSSARKYVRRAKARRSFQFSKR